MNKLLKYLLLGLAILFIILILVSTVLNGQVFLDIMAKIRNTILVEPYGLDAVTLVPIVLAIVA